MKANRSPPHSHCSQIPVLGCHFCPPPCNFLQQLFNFPHKKALKALSYPLIHVWDLKELWEANQLWRKARTSLARVPLSQRTCGGVPVAREIKLDVQDLTATPFQVFISGHIWGTSQGAMMEGQNNLDKLYFEMY